MMMMIYSSSSLQRYRRYYRMFLSCFFVVFSTLHEPFRHGSSITAVQKHHETVRSLQATTVMFGPKWLQGTTTMFPPTSPRLRQGSSSFTYAPSNMEDKSVQFFNCFSATLHSSFWKCIPDRENESLTSISLQKLNSSLWDRYNI